MPYSPVVPLQPGLMTDLLSFRFLDILAARKDPSGLSGEVLIDGAPQPPNFKCLSGYVVQVSTASRKPEGEAGSPLRF